MADNVAITPGTGDFAAADDIGGAKYQRIKLIYGPDGINSGDVDTANPLPIIIPGAVITWQAEGSIGAASLTASYQTIFTTSGAVQWLSFRNNTDGTVRVSPNSGATDVFTLDPGDAINLDLKPGKAMSASVAIQAKLVVTGTTGALRINGYY